MRVFMQVDYANGHKVGHKIVDEADKVLKRGTYSELLNWLIDEGCEFADHDGPVEGMLP